ncbi:hypothetical protein B0J15DRAFT_474017 [Fusarium solani]|uniref:Uncharacterized protein n=1 Tax=Fusarium solani TaxID=169388 RepID=A0A9P9L6F3_FUSSL|nr:uncharacterized protein B0J15DRAFT_474017 [Fusarium solani]KAH7275041.1 hypothetical protein B0J15DRAFT_474017 [Fusarium solani]
MPIFTPRLRPTMYSPPATMARQAPVLLPELPVPPPHGPVATPRYRNLSRPHPKDIVWPAPEIPAGGSGYGYPNVNSLHYMPDAEVYGYLIDSFRLRMQDIKGRPTTRLDIFYRDWNKDMAGFKHYLDLAEETPGLLPIEWKSKRAACESLCKLESYYHLENLDALDKPSIIKHHDGDRRCIHKLRELAQAVFGHAPGNLNIDCTRYPSDIVRGSLELNLIVWEGKGWVDGIGCW